MLAQGLTVKNPLLPWWRNAPEHWIYPLQTLVCGGLLLAWHRHYRLAPWRGIGLAALLGAVSIALWILPGWLGEQWRAAGALPQSWWEYAGLNPRLEGFDPTLSAGHPMVHALEIFFRFLRMVVVVPLVEELFWRSFLMRFLVARGERDFTQIPFGTHTWPAYFGTTLAVVLIHSPADWLGAFIFGSMIYWLAVRTRSLAACVLMHAVANLILGLYVMSTGKWGYW